MRIVADTADAVAMVSKMLAAIDFKSDLGKKVAKIMRDDVKSQFQVGGVAPAWPPLAPATIREKARIGYPRLGRHGLAPVSLIQRGAFGPANILERTGALLSSWTDESDPDHIENFEQDSLEIGSSLFYARFHQDDGPRKRLPQRAIGITDRALLEIIDLIEVAATEAN